MYMFESPWSRSRSALERKLTLITKMSIPNYSTVNSLHDSYLRLWHSWQNRWKYWASSPKLSPTGEMRKISTRRISCEPSDPNWVRVQRRAFKTKTLNISFTTHIHTFSKTHHFGAQIGPRSHKIVSKFEGGKHLREMRHEPSSPDFRPLQRWAYQTEALIKPSKLGMRTCDFLVENIGPSIPNFSTLTEMTKCQRETRNERSNPN